MCVHASEVSLTTRSIQLALTKVIFFFLFFRHLQESEKISTKIETPEWCDRRCSVQVSKVRKMLQDEENSFASHEFRVRWTTKLRLSRLSLQVHAEHNATSTLVATSQYLRSANVFRSQEDFHSWGQTNLLDVWYRYRADRNMSPLQIIVAYNPLLW